MLGKITEANTRKICLASLLIFSTASSQSVLAQLPTEVLPGQRIAVSKSQNCLVGKQQLIALMPKNNLALTTSAYPTFFFYIPETTRDKVIEFVLRDENEHQVYQTKFTTDKTSGIIHLKLPNESTLAGLAINKKYHWYLSLFCNQENRSDDLYVKGWTKRVEIDPTLIKKLATLTPKQRVNLYESAGIWHEALVTIADLRSQRPQDLSLSIQWTNLLQSVGLGNFAKNQ